MTAKTRKHAHSFVSMGEDVDYDDFHDPAHASLHARAVCAECGERRKIYWSDGRVFRVNSEGCLEEICQRKG